MGVDDLKEVIEKGYLGGKYIVFKIIKFIYEMFDVIVVVSEINE